MTTNHIPKGPTPYQEKIYTNGSQYFDDLVSDIRKAKKSILIETYIFANDQLGRRVINELNQKAAAGIDIKILVDGAGSPYFSTTLASKTHELIKTKVYHPFPWHFWNWSRSVVKLPFILKMIYLILMIQKRNHRKVYLIDDKIAYLGSYNITKKHLNRDDGGHEWRDTGIKISDGNFREINKAFEACWHHRSIREYLKEAYTHIRKNPKFRLNNTRHRRRILYKNLLKRIKTCRSKVWITNAYFVPDNRVLKKLIEVAKRGIDVKLIIPEKGDTLLPIPWATSLFYKSLLEAGVEIYEYLPNILHAKTIIIDEWSLVGSSNWDYLSLKHNLEIDTNLSCQNSINKISSIFEEDITQCKKLDLTNWKLNRQWYKRIIGRIILYFKYFI